MSESLLDFFFTSVGVLLVMVLLCILGCLLMKLSDLKMQRYILKTAEQKGLKVDLEKLKPRYTSQSTLANENCTIVVADVGFIM